MTHCATPKVLWEIKLKRSCGKNLVLEFVKTFQKKTKKMKKMMKKKAKKTKKTKKMEEEEEEERKRLETLSLWV